MLLRDNITGQTSPVKTEFSITQKGKHLICLFKAYDSSLNSHGDRDNDELYRGDVVEVLLDIGETNAYLEIEVAPNGKKFVANIIDKEIHFIENNFVKSKVEIQNNDYFVIIDIDLTKFNILKPIKYNAYRIETKGIKENYLLLAASPTMCDTFHVRDNFIKL